MRGKPLNPLVQAGHGRRATIKTDIMEKYNMTEEDYKLMELLIIERKPHKNGPQWKFAGERTTVHATKSF